MFCPSMCTTSDDSGPALPFVFGDDHHIRLFPITRLTSEMVMLNRLAISDRLMPPRNGPAPYIFLIMSTGTSSAPFQKAADRRVSAFMVDPLIRLLMGQTRSDIAFFGSEPRPDNSLIRCICKNSGLPAPERQSLHCFINLRSLTCLYEPDGLSSVGLTL